MTFLAKPMKNKVTSKEETLIKTPPTSVMKNTNKQHLQEMKNKEIKDHKTDFQQNRPGGTREETDNGEESIMMVAKTGEEGTESTNEPDKAVKGIKKEPDKPSG